MGSNFVIWAFVNLDFITPLLAEADASSALLRTIWGFTQAALGLGFVIFVHELGHFAVAKACGVKCEKFYLGFDIGGLKLAKFKWGETEYGIGVLPLGGYVKMLGQDDNPAKAAEERRRSTLAASSPEGAVVEEHGHAQILPGLAHSPSPTDAPLDPRSYMAKSVPQRMAIISAGVVMNVIFAFLMAALAFGLGVPEIPCGVSAVLPGEAAWKANLQPGDRILQIGDERSPYPLRFKDLMTAVALGDIKQGVKFLVQREGVKEPFWLSITPDISQQRTRLRPTIGAVNPRITTLAEPAAVPRTPAGETKKFLPEDVIVAVDDEPVKTYAELEGKLVRGKSKPLTFTVDRKIKDGKPETVDVTVPPRAHRHLGVAMRLGVITAVQADSPAEKAGIKADDFLVSIDGAAPGDVNPMTLPDVFRARAGETVKLGVTRKSQNGQDSTLEFNIVPRDPSWEETDVTPGSPLTIPALGIALKVLNIVQGVDAESPAATAIVKKGDAPAPVDHLATGDEILKAELVPAKGKDDEEKKYGPMKIEFSDDKGNWPYLVGRVQNALPDTQVRLTLRDDRTVLITPADAPGQFNADRGFIFQAETIDYRATSVGQAFAMAGRETVGALTQVYSFLRRIGTQISPFALGGPVTIIGAAGGAASEGFSSLLLFLTMLSANLAVINFLPIPVLDGGHMVFLALEGILRRPVSERVVLAFQYAGLLFIVTLMLFVLGLDFGLISRH